MNYQPEIAIDVNLWNNELYNNVISYIIWKMHTITSWCWIELELPMSIEKIHLLDFIFD